MNDKFLYVKDITFKYFEKSKHNILENASLEVGKGKVVVIIGNSGCGKSTMAAVCTGLYPENGGKLLSGEIYLEGLALNDLSVNERTSLLTMMFQNPDLQFCMETLRKEMIFCLENMCVPKENIDKMIKKLSTELHIEKLLDQKLYSLSGGEKQKAALSCLLLINSKGVFLDEPFANMDEASIKNLIDMLKEHNKKHNTTIIAIDHRIDYWLDIADEFIIVGEKGRIIARNINKENLIDYRKIFEDEGLFYPEDLNVFHRKILDDELAIELDNLSIKRRETNEFLLDGAQAKFPKGKITAILGHSGSGKTTLFSAFLKQKKYDGTILVSNHDIKGIKSKELFRTIGTVFQNPGNQFISTEVKKEVEESFKIWQPKLSEKEKSELTMELLDSYGLKKYSRYSPYMLSQGQQRRLAVLSILTGHQRILLMDEPTYGQDKRSTDAIMNQLLSLVMEKGLTVIFTTHDKNLAYKYADKIYWLEGGKLKEWKN